MRLTVNGKVREFDLASPTVSGLLDALGHAAQRVAVERNGVLIPRAEHSQTPLTDDDVVEVVTLVGGG